MSRYVSILIAGLSLCLCSAGRADIYTHTWNGGSANWESTTEWTPNGSPWSDSGAVANVDSGTAEAPGGDNTFAGGLYVNTGGTVKAGGASTSTTTFADLHLNGGTLGFTHANANVYIADTSGTITVEQDSTIALSSNAANSIRTGLTGSANLTIQGAGGLDLRGDNSGFTGNLNILAVEVEFADASALTGGDIIMSEDVSIHLDNNANWTVTNDFYGDGKFRLGSGGPTTYTLTVQGSTLSPGSAAAAGALLVQQQNAANDSHLAFAVDGGDHPTLIIDVFDNAGTVEFDQLLVNRGNVTGLANLHLVLNVHDGLTVAQLNAAGELPILQILDTDGGAYSLDASTVYSYTLNGDLTPEVGFHADRIALSNWTAVPEPATLALLGIGGLALGGRVLRRRRT